MDEDDDGASWIFVAQGEGEAPLRAMRGRRVPQIPGRTARYGFALIVVYLAVPVFLAEGTRVSAAFDGLVQADPLADTLLYSATFDTAWTRIRETHYSRDMNGVDWDRVRTELRPRAVAAGSDAELRSVVREMLARLGESHFVLISSDGTTALGTAAGDGDPGFEMRWVEGDLLVFSVREGSAAAGAGVRAGWIVEAIAGVPTDTLIGQVRSAGYPGSSERQIQGWLPVVARNRTMGEVGTEVEVHFLDGAASLRVVHLRREPPSSAATRIGNLPPIRAETRRRIESLPDGRRIGILTWTAWVPSTVSPIGEAVDAFRSLDGIVLDLRGNPGGLGALAMGVGGHFLDGGESLGTMITRETSLRFVTNPQRVSREGARVDPYSGPLAILLDALSGSTSEIFAAGMQALGRARIFGERSAGQALPAVITPLPNGDRLLHAVADFEGPNGVRLEGTGVIPDVEVLLDRELLLQGKDPVLDAAFEWLRTQD